MSKKFVHLHCHSEFSLLDGASKVEDLVSAAVKDGQPAIASTEHGNMYGIIPFYKECKKQGIKFIPGMEAYMANETRFERLPLKTKRVDDTGGETEEGQKQYYHLTLLAETNEGYQNLIKLSSEAFLTGYYRKGRVDWELLEQYSKGLIATSGCLGGHVLQSLLKDDYPDALKKASRLQDIFGRDNFFIELQDHGLPEQHQTNPKLIQLGKDINAPLVASNDSHYTNKKDSYSHSCLLCVQTGSLMSDKKRFKFQGSEHYFKTSQEMRHLFHEIPGACDNTLWIAERSDVEIEFGNLKLPQFPVPQEYESDRDYLRHLVYEGAKNRWPTITEEIVSRIDYELSVIGDMGYSSYFLIVWDLIRYAKQNNIRCGPGRGSVGGSIVAYCVEMTQLDPLKYDLIFERFLNPERASSPDYDWDVDTRYRDQLINYAASKYGRDHVAQVITFASIKARSAVRDAARVMGHNYSLGDKIAKAIPALISGRDTSLEHCMKKTEGYEQGYDRAQQVRKLYKENAEAKEIIDVALGMEGLRRSDSIHAAAVVITPTPVTDFTPVQRKPTPDQDIDTVPIVTQYDGKSIEALGILKMDFLGLKNLDIIDETLRLIPEKFNIDEIDLEDAKTLELLARGDTIGVFQLEGVKMRTLERSLKVDRFGDVAALVALYRPGPMAANMHNDYADRKNGRKEIKTFHPDADEILSDTYGLMIYQEELMQIAQKFAGFSLAEADLLRRSVGKKEKEEMATFRDKFIKGCINEGYDESLGKEIFGIIEPFADYSFPKSHSFLYGFISFQTAYLKANYPTQYFSALLSHMSDLTKAALYITDAKARNIDVLVPDINTSFNMFTPEGNNIRFGFSTVKNVGDSVADLIIAAREDGNFKSFEDFCNRVDNTALNKRTLESLIKAGAFDSFNLSREGLLKSFPDVVKVAKKKKVKEASGEMTLFDEPILIKIENIKLSKKNRLMYEREMLGLYLTDHPLRGIEDYLSQETSHTLEEVLASEEIESLTVGGVITDIEIKTTRKQDTMATFKLSDTHGSIEVVVFPKTYEIYKDILVEDNVITVMGRSNIRDDEVNIIASELDTFDASKYNQSLNLEIDNLTDEKLLSLKHCINMHRGNSPLLIHTDQKTYRLSGYEVTNDSALIHELKVCMGPSLIIS